MNTAVEPVRWTPETAATEGGQSLSVAITGSGGAGAMTAATLLLDTASRAGLYAYFTRSSGAQIRGGEAAAMVRLASGQVDGHGDHYHLMVAIDWDNVQRFAAEIPLAPESLILCDPAAGDVPAVIAASGARVVPLPLAELAAAIPGGRANMVALGALTRITGLPLAAQLESVSASLAKKGEAAVAASRAAVEAGHAAAAALPGLPPLTAPAAGAKRWSITGNEAAGLGAVRGGVRFVAAYPITPGTEILEWLAPALDRVGGVLVQAEDELASINMIIGAAWSGVPALTATAGPGLALMTESIGLAVAAEVPIVVVDVMRGGPSTGIPVKSEQSDLNIALYGLHGDAPHLVLAPLSVSDCLFTTQWAVHLAESMQTAAIVLSDQSLGQTRSIVAEPPEHAFAAARLTAPAGQDDYRRYAVTESGVSPMALPGTPGCQYTADGLEHNAAGTPSSQAGDHQAQMDKRERKLASFDYGEHWALVEGEGEVALLTWGSSTGPVREAAARLNAAGIPTRVVAPRLLAPVQPDRMAAALDGVRRVLVVEQSHGAQFLKVLRAHYDLPGEVRALHRPGPLPIRPGEVAERILEWK